MKTRGRKLVISNRHLRHSIATMVQNDPVRALVELITNSDDSYARLEAEGEQISGKILVDVIERRSGEPSIIRVSDDAPSDGQRPCTMLAVQLGDMGYPNDTGDHLTRPSHSKHPKLLVSKVITQVNFFPLSLRLREQRKDSPTPHSL